MPTQIEIAQAEVGYEGGPNEGSKYGDWYGMPNAPWCAMFVSFCLRGAGINSPYFSYCPDGVNQFRSAGLFDTDWSTARPGDVVFYDWNADGVASHTGLVESIDADGTVHTIEGNRALPGDDGNPEVARHTIPGEAGWSVVLGFGHVLAPAPPAPAPAPPTTTEEDMPLTNTDLQAIADNVVRPLLADFWNGQFKPALDDIDNRIKKIEDHLGIPE